MAKRSRVYIARKWHLVHFQEEAVITLAELLDVGMQLLGDV